MPNYLYNKIKKIHFLCQNKLLAYKLQNRKRERTEKAVETKGDKVEREEM